MLSGAGPIQVTQREGRITRSDGLTTGAEFSTCYNYRYNLWRRWDVEDMGRPFVVIGLNPSTDRAVAIDGKYGTYPVKLWRYECEMCDWVWANLAQREHNAEAERRARRDMKQRALRDL